jgi:hypothetical protein
MTAPRDDRSLGELFGELSEQTSTLVKKEIELARHEVTRSVTSLGRDAAVIGLGAAIAYAGLIVLLIGIGWLLVTIGLPVWMSFVLVGLVVLAIGAFLAWRSIQSMKKTSVVPERTVETVRDDVEWAKDQTQ